MIQNPLDYVKGAALVLEGGGMRGVFTAGVLDYFMDAGLTFPYAVAVSAGACHGLSFMSHQRGRAKASSIEMLEKYRYIGMKYLWTHKSIFNTDIMYRDLPNRILPYDYAACFQNEMRFEMVTTSCRTGLACYLEERRDPERLLRLAQASSSLPFVCPIVYVDHEPMLDGGIADSIPVARAWQQGFERTVLVLTRNFGFRQQRPDVRIPYYIYRRFPRLRVALSHMGRVYNEQLALCDQLETSGRALVIRPRRPLEVDRLGSDIKKLRALYEEGYAEAQRVLAQ